MTLWERRTTMPAPPPSFRDRIIAKLGDQYARDEITVEQFEVNVEAALRMSHHALRRLSLADIREAQGIS